MHTCAKFWTRNAAVQSVRTPRQVLNPDFEKNMAKNWAEFRQPSRADGLTEGAQLSAQQRAATKGQICACTFSRVLASALASRTNFRGLAALSPRICAGNPAEHTHVQQIFDMPCNSAKCSNSNDKCSIQTFKTIWKKLGRVPAAQPGWWLGGGSKQDTILFQFCSAESWPPLWNCTNRPLRLWPSYKRLRSYELQASIAKFELKHSWCNEHSQTFFCQKPWQQKRKAGIATATSTSRHKTSHGLQGATTFAYNPTCGSQHPSFKRFALPAGCTCALMRHILRSRNPAREMGAKSAPLQQGLLSTCNE